MPRDSRLYMTFPIDFPWHPKVSRLDKGAKWTFVEMNGHSRMNELDGVISVVEAEFMWDPADLEALLRSHPTRPLVFREGDNYVIRDYAEHQFTKADRDELTRKRSEAGRKGGLAKSQASASKSQAAGGKPNQSQSQSPESGIDGTTTQVSLSSSGSESEDGRTDDDISTAVLTGYGIDPDRLVAHIASSVGRDVTVTEAKNVATSILERGDNVKKPQAYVLGSITKSPAEVRDQIDASRPSSTPSRAAECPNHPHYPLPCDRCRRDAEEGG